MRGGPAARGVLLLTGALGILALSASDARAGEDDSSLDLGGATLELRKIPKGVFAQGSPANEPGHEFDESQRAVTITHDFWMGKYAVTRGQFQRFVGETKYQTEAERGGSGGVGWDGKGLSHKKEFTWRNPGFAQTENDPVV